MKVIVIACATLVTAAAEAQVGANPAGANPATPGIEATRPRPDEANSQDMLFLRLAHIGNTAEVALAKLARSRGADADVKAFADRMASEHDASLGKLRPLMQRANTPAPRDLDPEHKDIQAALGKLNGAAFDTAYIRAQVADHQKTAQLLQWQIAFGQSEPIKAYSKQTLPAVLSHLEHARNLNAKLTGAAP